MNKATLLLGGWPFSFPRSSLQRNHPYKMTFIAI
jgi:hypothetical protein